MKDHKINVDLRIDFNKNSKTLAITETIQSEMYNELRSVKSYLYNLHEEAIHESLKELGWTLPSREPKQKKYKNSRRPQDIRVENKSKDEIIEILYNRLDKSQEILRKIGSLVGSSFGTKNELDKNGEILNPLWSTFNEPTKKINKNT